MERDISSHAKIWPKTKWIINLLSCIAVFVMTIFICYVPFLRYHYLFTWHVILGTIAYILLFPPSFLIFSNSWFLGLSRKHRSWIHAIISGVASVLAIICVFLDYYRKEVYLPEYPDITHFESPHAVTGLISVVLLLIANISGCLTGIITWFQKKFLRPVSIKLFHNILGQAAFIVGIISVCIVFHIPWFAYYTNLATRVSLTLFTILVTIWSLVNSVLSAKNQIGVIIES